MSSSADTIPTLPLPKRHLGLGTRHGHVLASCARHWRIRRRPGPRDATCEEAASKASSQGSRHGCHQLTARTCLWEVSKLPDSPVRHRVVIVGAGFAGYNAARELSKLPGASIEITVINSTDYFLYLPLLPQVAAGLVEPRHICVSLLRRMPKVRFVLGTVTHIDVRQKVVTWSSPEGGSSQAGYDRLILTAGSVNKLLPIPGVADYAHGFRSVAEAIYLRDHIIRQLELAAGAADEAERQARCTFVVVGAGYTGTEVAAQGQLLTARLAKQMPGLVGGQIRWMLLDNASRVLPELDPRLSRAADRVLRRRGVEVRTGQSVATALDSSWVQLSTGEKVATHSLIWCVGVRADPLVTGLDLDTNRGRLVVDEFMSVPGARGGARPDPARGNLRHDRPACPAPGQAGRQERRRLPRSREGEALQTPRPRIRR